MATRNPTRLPQVPEDDDRRTPSEFMDSVNHYLRWQYERYGRYGRLHAEARWYGQGLYFLNAHRFLPQPAHKTASLDAYMEALLVRLPKSR